VCIPLYSFPQSGHVTWQSHHDSHPYRLLPALRAPRGSCNRQQPRSSSCLRPQPGGAPVRDLHRRAVMTHAQKRSEISAFAPHFGGIFWWETCTGELPQHTRCYSPVHPCHRDFVPASAAWGVCGGRSAPPAAMAHAGQFRSEVSTFTHAVWGYSCGRSAPASCRGAGSCGCCGFPRRLLPPWSSSSTAACQRTRPRAQRRSRCAIGSTKVHPLDGSCALEFHRQSSPPWSSSSTAACRRTRPRDRWRSR